MLRPPHTSTLFPYTTLFRSVRVHEDLESGYPLYSQIMPLLDSGTINPFGPTSGPPAIAAAKATEFIGQDFASETSLTSLAGDRKSTRLNSSHRCISYAVFCL